MKGVLRLEIEKHQTSNAELDNLSEGGSMTNDSIDPGDRVTESTLTKFPSNFPDGPQISSSKGNASDGKEISGNGSSSHGNSNWHMDYVSLASAFDIALHYFVADANSFGFGISASILCSSWSRDGYSDFYSSLMMSSCSFG